MAQSPETPPQAPGIKSEQQNDNALKVLTSPDSQLNSSDSTVGIQRESDTKSEATRHEHSKETTSEASEFWTILGRTIKITDTLLVVFTFLLFLATVGLFWATRDLVKGADHNAEKQLRAYVFVKDGAVEVTPDGVGFVFGVILRNFGQTPGHEYSTWLGGGIYPTGELPFPKEPKPLSERVNRSIIGPNAETPIITASVALSPDDRQAIRNGTKAIFVWGGADYVDAFGKPRHLILRMRMTGPESQLRPGVTGWLLTPHPLGYEAN